MLSPISGFCSLHLPQVLRKENLFSLKNCTDIWDNSRDAAKAGDEATSIPPLQRGPGSRYLRPFSPHLQPLLNTFVPRRGTKPFRLELPLEEENPISQSLLPPQEPTLHPTIPSLAVLHSQGSKKHQSCQIKPGEMVSPTHLPAGNLTELSVDVQAG